MPQEHWTIDRRVPLAVILGMIAQAAAILIWGVDLEGRVSVMETHRADVRLQALERDVPVIREKIQSIEKATDRIEKKLDKLSANWPQKHTAAWQENQLLLAELKSLGEIKTA